MQREEKELCNDYHGNSEQEKRIAKLCPKPLRPGQEELCRFSRQGVPSHTASLTSLLHLRRWLWLHSDCSGSRGRLIRDLPSHRRRRDDGDVLEHALRNDDLV